MRSSRPSPRARSRVAITIAFLLGAIAIPAAFAAVGSNRSVPLAGQLSARHSDDFAHNRSTLEYVVESDGKTVPVRVSERQAAPLLGKRVHVSYRADGLAELVAADGTSGGTTTATTVATGTYRKVAIILLTFSNDTRQPWTPDQVRAVAFDKPDELGRRVLQAGELGPALAHAATCSAGHDPRLERDRLQLLGLG